MGRMGSSGLEVEFEGTVRVWAVCWDGGIQSEKEYTGKFVKRNSPIYIIQL